ncbi:uncharacterized protein [Diabrotica undecimpunctata]
MTNKAVPQDTQPLSMTNKAVPQDTDALTMTNKAVPQDTQPLTMTNKAVPQDSQPLILTNEAVPQHTQLDSVYGNSTKGDLVSALKPAMDSINITSSVADNVAQWILKNATLTDGAE